MLKGEEGTAAAELAAAGATLDDDGVFDDDADDDVFTRLDTLCGCMTKEARVSLHIHLTQEYDYILNTCTPDKRDLFFVLVLNGSYLALFL